MPARPNCEKRSNGRRWVGPKQTNKVQKVRASEPLKLGCTKEDRKSNLGHRSGKPGDDARDFGEGKRLVGDKRGGAKTGK